MLSSKQIFTFAEKPECVESSLLSLPRLAARPAAVPTHLPGLQGAEQRSAALRDALRSAGSSQRGAGKRRGGGGPHSSGTCVAGTDAYACSQDEEVFFFYLFVCLCSSSATVFCYHYCTKLII